MSATIELADLLTLNLPEVATHAQDPHDKQACLDAAEHAQRLRNILG